MISENQSKSGFTPEDQILDIQKCSECQETYFRKDMLDLHISVTHKGERKFQCKFCERKFGYKWELNYHVTNLHKKESHFENNIANENPKSNDETNLCLI